MVIAILVFLLIIAVAIGIPLFKAWRRRQAEAAIRENPPETVRFQVKLPSDADQTNMLMTRFWDRIHRHLPADEKSNAANTNTIHTAYIGYGAGVGLAPKVTFVVWCHPSLAEKLELDLAECYNSDAQITALDEDKDPFGKWMIKYRAQAEYQRQVAALASSSSDDEEDEDDD